MKRPISEVGANASSGSSGSSTSGAASIGSGQEAEGHRPAAAAAISTTGVRQANGPTSDIEAVPRPTPGTPMRTMLALKGQDNSQSRGGNPAIYFAPSLHPIIRLEMNRELTKVDGDRINWNTLVNELLRALYAVHADEEDSQVTVVDTPFGKASFYQLPQEPEIGGQTINLDLRPKVGARARPVLEVIPNTALFGFEQPLNRQDIQTIQDFVDIVAEEEGFLQAKAFLLEDLTSHPLPFRRAETRIQEWVAEQKLSREGQPILTQATLPSLQIAARTPEQPARDSASAPRITYGGRQMRHVAAPGAQVTYCITEHMIAKATQIHLAYHERDPILCPRDSKEARSLAARPDQYETHATEQPVRPLVAMGQGPHSQTLQWMGPLVWQCEYLPDWLWQASSTEIQKVMRSLLRVQGNANQEVDINPMTSIEDHRKLVRIFKAMKHLHGPEWTKSWYTVSAGLVAPQNGSPRSITWMRPGMLTQAASNLPRKTGSDPSQWMIATLATDSPMDIQLPPNYRRLLFPGLDRADAHILCPVIPSACCFNLFDSTNGQPLTTEDFLEGNSEPRAPKEFKVLIQLNRIGRSEGGGYEDTEWGFLSTHWAHCNGQILAERFGVQIAKTPNNDSVWKAYAVDSTTLRRAAKGNHDMVPRDGAFLGLVFQKLTQAGASGGSDHAPFGLNKNYFLTVSQPPGTLMHEVSATSAATLVVEAAATSNIEEALLNPKYWFAARSACTPVTPE